MKEELIDLEGAYEDLKEYLLNLHISCVNCIHKDKDTMVCDKCQFAFFWELDSKIIDEIENKNLIEDDEDDLDEEQKYQHPTCPKCNKILAVDTTYQLASYPPQYETFCECGYNGFIYCKDYRG